MAQRQRNPRRVLLDMLATPRKRVSWVRDRWIYRGTRMNYEILGERPRLRTPEEYPENDAHEWRMVVAQIDEAIAELVKVRDFAEAQGRHADRR